MLNDAYLLDMGHISDAWYCLFSKKNNEIKECLETFFINFVLNRCINYPDFNQDLETSELQQWGNPCDQMTRYTEFVLWLSKRCSGIWSDSQEQSEKVFSSEFVYIVLVAQIESKNILRMFSRIRPDLRTALTQPERI